jgi:hypothetical protein
MLVNSNDTKTFTTGPKRFEIVARRMEEEFGEPVELSVKSVWPRETMPAVIEKWMDETQPDLVYLNVVALWFQYESVPLRARRIFGLGTKSVGDAIFSMANAQWWMRNAVFRGLRNGARWVVGGDHHFTREQVVERVGESVRIMARREDTVVVVKGARALAQHGTNFYRQRRADRDRDWVDAAVRRLCEQHHAVYTGLEVGTNVQRRGMKHRADDRLHLNAQGHLASADDHFPPIRDAWAAHLRATSGERQAGIV